MMTADSNGGHTLKTKLLKPHVKGCHSVRAWPQNPWWITGKTLYRDALGRTNNGTSTPWMVLACNWHKCDAKAIVRQGDITSLAQRALEEARR